MISNEMTYMKGGGLLKKIMIGTILFLSLLSLAACGSKVSYEPREVNADIDVCEVCNMSIVHSGYATQLIEKDGTVHMYDDLGCMMQFLDGAGKELDVEATYVRDIDTLDWIALEEAYYVHEASIWTPMAYGVVTFTSLERAEQYVQQEGKGNILHYEDIQNFTWDGF